MKADIVRVTITLKLVKKRAGQPLQPRVTISDITIAIPSRPCRMEAEYSRKNPLFVHPSTLSKCDVRCDAQTLISYYTLEKVELGKSMGKTVYDVDDNYHENPSEKGIASNEESFEEVAPVETFEEEDEW